MMLTIADIKSFVMKHLTDATGSHHWDHTQRVFNMCMHIGGVEASDMEILTIAAYLHDVGRPFQDESKGTICHAEKGAQMASSLLERYPLSSEKKANIIHCVRSHRFRGNCKPDTPEAKILFDADKLDAIGAIGIGRAFLFAGEVGARLHNPDLDAESARPYSVDDTGYREFKVKLCKIKDRMLTAQGRKWACERHAFMNDFFNRFLAEYEGKR